MWHTSSIRNFFRVLAQERCGVSISTKLEDTFNMYAIPKRLHGSVYQIPYRYSLLLFVVSILRYLYRTVQAGDKTSYLRHFTSPPCIHISTMSIISSLLPSLTCHLLRSLRRPQTTTGFTGNSYEDISLGKRACLPPSAFIRVSQVRSPTQILPNLELNSESALSQTKSIGRLLLRYPQPGFVL
jgi:hypothetical protein